MEYKFEHTPRRTVFEATVAALEFANPRVKGGLAWCRATLAGWSVSDPIHHTVPLLRAPCSHLACYMAFAGRPRAASGMIVQRESGLRPGEVIPLYPDDVSYQSIWRRATERVERPLLWELAKAQKRTESKVLCAEIQSSSVCFDGFASLVIRTPC